MAQVTVTKSRQGLLAKTSVPLVVSRALLSATDLPPMMEVADPRGSYRYPLLQFIMDWNSSDAQARLIKDPPVYTGDDPVLLPAIAVVVHALADRADIPVPDWVYRHRAPNDTVLFVYKQDGKYAQWLRRRSHPVSAYHRVHIHPRMIDKGTPDWWLPWD